MGGDSFEERRLPRAALDAAPTARFAAPAWAATDPAKLALMLRRFHAVELESLVRELRAVAEVADLSGLEGLELPVHL